MVGFASLNPPYEGSLPAHKEGSGTPADAIFVSRTQRRAGRATERAACAAPPLSGALACRRSTTALAKGTRHPNGSASGQASWEANVCLLTEGENPPFRDGRDRPRRS